MKSPGLKLGVEIFGVEMSATLVLSEQPMLPYLHSLIYSLLSGLEERGKVLGPSKHLDFPFF